MKRILLFCFAFTTACSESFDEQLDSAELTVERKDVGQYRVVIETPKDQTLAVIRSSPYTPETKEITKGQTGFIVDEDAKTGELYRYKFGKFEDNKFQEAYYKDIKIPLDIISSNLSELPNHYYQMKATKDGGTQLEIETMVLDKGYPFVTNGARGEITVKKLVSNHGEIFTFAPGAKAANGTPGKSGGPLRIRVLSGEGDLTFTMRGQIGGDGIQPPPIGEEGRGAKGPKGADGAQHDHYVYSTGNTKHHCKQPASPGGKGGKGAPGLPGTSGLPGGNSGELFLEVSPSANLAVVTKKYLGPAGKGSPGGLGGPGGYPGEPGNLIISFSTEGSIDDNVRHWGPECAKPGPGPMGDNGDQGATGPNSVDGTIEKTCMKHIGTENWSCEL